VCARGCSRGARWSRRTCTGRRGAWCSWPARRRSSSCGTGASRPLPDGPPPRSDASVAIRPRTHRDRQGQFRFGCAKTAPGLFMIRVQLLMILFGMRLIIVKAQLVSGLKFFTDENRMVKSIWIQNGIKTKRVSSQMFSLCCNPAKLHC
jgi:hypothetical protein